MIPNPLVLGIKPTDYLGRRTLQYRVLAPMFAIMLLLPTHEALAGTKNLFKVVAPAHALFTQGTGQKKVTLNLLKTRVQKLEIAVSTKFAATEKEQNKPFEHLVDKVTNNKASLELKLPRLGLFDADVTALDSDGHSVGEQVFRIAALGPEVGEPVESIGVNTHFGHKTGKLSESMALIRRAGFGRIRDQIPWTSIEHNPGQFKFPKIFDRYLADADKRGIQPLVILGQANTRTYHELLSSDSNFLAIGQPMDLFQQYVRAVVGRYGREVHTWELWNEPNFGKKGVAKRYSALLKKTYATLKKIAPKDRLIACGGAGVGGGPNGACFLDMIKYGAGKDMDGYSIHPYMGTGNPPGKGYRAHKSVVPRVSVPVVWRYNAKLIREKKHHIKNDLRLWITELGWFSSPVKRSDGQRMQAAYFDQLYLLSRKYDQAKAVFWYDFRDDGNNPKNKEDNFGLITHDYQPKPAYVAAATLSRTLGDRHWSGSLKVAKQLSGVEVERYGQGNNTVVAAWTTSSATKAKLHVEPGQYMIRQWDGTQSVVDVGSGYIHMRLSDLPIYIFKPSLAQR